MGENITSATLWDTRKSFAVGVLLLLILFHSVNNYIVLKQDSIPFQGDPADLYLSSARFLTALKRGSLKTKLTAVYTTTSEIYPPTIGIVSVILFSLFGISQDVAVMANIPFFALLIIITYLLGKELFNRETGLLAAILLSFFPATFSLSRAYMPSLSMMALVTLSVFLLIKSTQFSSRNMCVLLGISLGFTALTKPMFSLFLLGPFLVVLKDTLTGTAKDRKNWGKTAKNLAITLGIMILIAGPWYIIHTEGYLKQQKFFLPLEEHHQDSQYTKPIIDLTIDALSRQLLPCMAFLFLISTGVFILHFRKHRALLLSWIVIPYIAFFFSKMGLFNLMRFTPATLPAMAVIISAVLWKVASAGASYFPKKKTTLISLMLLIIIVLEISLFVRMTYVRNGTPLLPMEDSRAMDAVQLNYLGRTSARQNGFDTRTLALLIKDELDSCPSEKSIFLLNWFGLETHALHTEMELITINNPSFTYSPVTCLWFEWNGEEKTAWTDTESCISRIESSCIIIIQSVRRDEWWIADNSMYTYQIVPLMRYLEDNHGQYTTVSIVNTTISPGRSELDDLTLDASFNWLQDSVWVLRNPASQTET